MNRYVVIFIFTLLFSSCQKEPIPIIDRYVDVVVPHNKTKMIKKKRKIKLFKIFKKKVDS